MTYPSVNHAQSSDDRSDEKIPSGLSSAEVAERAASFKALKNLEPLEPRRKSSVLARFFGTGMRTSPDTPEHGTA